MKMIGKKGMAGESIMMIYRLMLISIIAIVILGLAAVFYDYYIDVRSLEAGILNQKVTNCLAPEGILDLTKINDEQGKNILDYCGIKNVGRMFVRVNVSSTSDGKSMAFFQQGDSGSSWVRDLYKNSWDSTGKIRKYEPGYSYSGSSDGYNIWILDSGKKISGKLIVEAFVNHEF